MDVKSKCNVGYAFINIREQSKVQVFYHKLQGKMWDRFNPDKCCQITYGRIQGFDALLKTFAESSVVRECRSSGEMGAEHVQACLHQWQTYTASPNPLASCTRLLCTRGTPKRRDVRPRRYSSLRQIAYQKSCARCQLSNPTKQCFDQDLCARVSFHV